MNKKFLPICLILATMFSGCQEGNVKSGSDNPLLSDFDTPFEAPPFDLIKDEHFAPAFEEAIKQHNEEIDAIVSNSEEPSFENTIVALEDAGSLLSRTSSVFYPLISANTNETLQELAKEYAPKFSAHSDDIYLNDGLFAKVKEVYEQKESLDLDNQDLKLLEETYKGFVRSGANLNDEEKQRLKDINSEISSLTTQFGQNALSEVNAFELFVDNEEDLSGLPNALKQAAKKSAEEAGKPDQWLFTLHNSSLMPFLQFADNRDLRFQMWDAYQKMGNNGNDQDNNDLITKIANLRLEKANLLGYKSHAAYVLEESMAENPENVDELLNKLWAPAIAKAKVELADIQSEVQSEGNDFTVEPHDWRYYTEKIRQKRYALSDEELRPYFSLESVKSGAFETATKLYGLSFVGLNNIPVYHPEVEVYEVKDKDGELLGLLYTDFFPRSSKKSGAWMTSFRSQGTEDGKRKAPLISIVCNFTKPVGDTPALLTFDEATTLFHEFGHALHGLLSDVKYRSLAGTAVSRDFVELPSQVMENWAADPEVMKTYAKHYETGEVIPDELIEKLQASGTFNQGFATTEYLAASFLDMGFHGITEPITTDASVVEKNAMEKIGLIDAIIPRYRSTYFQHVFSGGYSSGYYAYIWAEVLDADAFAAFKEKGIFDQETANAFRTEILELGATDNPAEMYKKFRGSDPNPVYLMKKRGLE